MKPRHARWLLGCGLLATLAASLAWFASPRSQRVYTDADAIRQPVTEVSPRDVLWQPPRPLAEMLNTSEQDYEPRLSWDGLTLYFVRGKAGGGADLYTATRTPHGWSEATPLEALNSEHDDLGPAPSPDGEGLYFYSDRPGGQGGFELWWAARGVNGWQAPTNLGPAVNSEYNDYGPAPGPNGELYFASNRPRDGDTLELADPAAWPATVREDFTHRTYDLYVTTLDDAGPAPARPLSALNTSANEGAPCLSPAGDFLYFASDRPGGAGGFDLYRARLLRGAFQPPEALRELNTPAHELDPALASLGFALLFSSDRPREGLSQRASGVRDYDLYYTTSREVFTDSERLRSPTIDWAALLRQLGPNLLWLLLALLLLLLAFVVGRDLRDKRLGLLARCLLASLMAHLLLLIMFSFWRVGSAIADALQGASRQRITLSSPVGADSLLTQIRGNLTDPQPVAVASVDPALAPLHVDLVHQPEAPQLEVGRADIQPAPAAIMTADSAPPPTDPPAAMTPAPASFELALHTPAQPTPAAEPDQPRELAQASAAHPARPTRPAHDPVAPEAMSISLAPLTRDPNEPLPATRSLLAGMPGPRDALPPQSAPDATLFALKSSAPRSAMEVATPQATPARAEESPNPSPTPPVAMMASPARPAHDVADKPSPAPAKPVTLSAAPSKLPDVALASDARVVPEAPARSSPPFGPASASLAPPAAPTMALALPPLEEARAQVTAKADGDRAGPVTERIHAPARPIATTAINTTAPLVAIRPAPSPEAAAPMESLATAPLPAAPAPIASDPVPDALAPTPPPEMALSLPNELPPTRAALPDERPAPDLAIEPPPQAPAVGVIRGVVADEETGEPLAGARIRLDLPEMQPIIATSDALGRYALEAPLTPDFFALSASRDGYAPQSLNIPAEELRGAAFDQNFDLKPQSNAIVPLEAEPQVHHLGNDAWEGAINSQFQRKAEGRVFIGLFELSEDQLVDVRRARVTLLAKGVQCPHRMLVNGVLLDKRLDRAPQDGSFGEFQARIPVDLLRPGLNIFEIQAISCTGDLDDFEFVNIQFRLDR